MNIVLDTRIPALAVTSNLLNLEFTTDSPFLQISIYYNTARFYETKLYAYDGQVTFYDFRRIIETYFLLYNRTYSHFEIQVEASDAATKTYDIDVLYCTHIVSFDPSLFTTKYFLTSLASKRTFPKATEMLSFYHGVEKGNCVVRCYFTTAGGTRQNEEFILASYDFASAGVETISLKCSDFMAKLTELQLSPESINAYVVTFNGRTFPFYVLDETPTISFTFRNCFNTWEVMNLKAIVVKSSTAERSDAISNSLLQFYDQHNKQEFSVSSAPLPDGEIKWAEQLLISPVVKYGISATPDSLETVAISSAKCEYSNNNSEMNSVKFSYQYADGRPRFAHIFDGNGGIFTEEFGPEFT